MLQSGFLQQHRLRLALEISSLRRQAEALNSPNTYVKCAKYQRLANAKEKELAALDQGQATGANENWDAVLVAIKVRAGVAATSVCGWMAHGQLQHTRIPSPACHHSSVPLVGNLSFSTGPIYVCIACEWVRAPPGICSTASWSPSCLYACVCASLCPIICSSAYE